MERTGQIWKQYQSTIMSRRIVIEHAIASLFGSDLTEPMRRKAERAADKLASLVGSYGLGTAARIAREIGGILAGGTGAAHVQAPRLLELLTQLRRELENSSDATADDEARTTVHILIVDHTTTLVEAAAIEAGKLGLNAEVAFDLAGARELVRHQNFDLILLNLYSPGGREGALAFIREMAHMHPHLPVIVMSATDAVDDRLEVARAGGHGYLRKALSIRQLIQLAYRRWQQLGLNHSFQSLLASTNESLQQRLLPAFRDAQRNLFLAGDPQSLWDALFHTHPDVLLLDSEPDEEDALDLCQMIRNEPRWSTLPIVLLGACSPARARAVGVDAILPHDIEGAELVECLQSRMNRVHIYRNFGNIDTLTGTFSMAQSRKMTKQLLQLATRQKQPFTLLVAQLDQIAIIRKNQGPGAADIVQHRLAQLLIRLFRSEDVVARWSGDEIVVGMFGIDRNRALVRAGQLLERIARNPFPEPEWATIPVTLSIGLAQYPVDGEKLDKLYESAQQALQIAREHGGNRVLRTGEAAAPVPLLERVDVVAVDANAESIGPLIEALQDDKLSVRWLRSGEEAIRLLTGSSRSLGTSIVLLAAELPDMDGFRVFQQFLREVAVRDVIILADAPSQDQVLSALQLGAIDYITRPFDIAALVERVHAALQE